MAKHLGGIYSKPSGKAGSIVWGRARTFYGKLATSREWVIPTDPNTDDQSDRRLDFASAIHVATLVGTPIWQQSWNNTLGDLPGFQAFTGHLIDSIQAVDHVPTVIATPPDKSLGPVYMPEFTWQTTPAGGHIKAIWDAECVGDHCAAGDKLMGFMVLKEEPDTVAGMEILLPDAILRSTAEWTSGDQAGLETDVYAALWFQHDPGGIEPLEWSSLAQFVGPTSAA